MHLHANAMCYPTQDKAWSYKNDQETIGATTDQETCSSQWRFE